MRENIDKNNIINVQELLCLPNLAIPAYQRPYKWTTKNVIQLLQDVQLHKAKSAYRLGTVVIHKEINKQTNFNNIVDGQQRTITLLLIAKSVIDSHYKKGFKHNGLTNSINELKKNMFEPKFAHYKSINHIKANYAEIDRFVNRMSEDELFYLFTQCQFIKFELDDISEAFQFFDSQNSRGKDLEPHDLLKAYHLREFSVEEEEHQETVVDTWEEMESKDIASLFAEYLYRIKGWSKGDSSRYFTKDEIDLFKGVNLNRRNHFPFTEMMRISHFYVDRYNDSYERNIDLKKTNFPFQLDQTIINGKRFFELVTHYKTVFDSFSKKIKESNSLDEQARDIITTLESYEARWRTGDQYIRNLFNCAVIYYIDKFGYTDISRAIEKLFVWAYRLRLRHHSVYLASVDNYVVNEFNVFKLIKEAIYPKDVLTMHIPLLTGDVKSKRTKEIEDLFNALNYYDN